MARAIDKQTMLDLIIEAKRMDPETGSFSEWLAEYLVDHLTTLTPPNEWVSVENAVPDPGERVLATDGTFVGEAYRTSANTWYRHTGFPWRDCLQSIVTLWMPLPTVDKDNHVPAKAPNEPLTCKGDENGEQRLIDANKILYHQAWESGSMEPANEGVALMSEVQAMPTIDPEALPIVRQLREELERVTAERDAAMEDVAAIIGDVEEIRRGYGVDNADADGAFARLCETYCANNGCLCYAECEKYHCKNFKWRGPHKED